MKKLVLLGVIIIFLITFVGTGTAMAQPGPWKSKNSKVEVVDPSPASHRKGESLLRLWTGDGGFQLWITGNRELHCVYKLEGHNSGNGWTSSTWMPGYVYKCNVLFE